MFCLCAISHVLPLESQTACRFRFQFFCFSLCQLLHRVLVAEINALQGMAAIGQRPLLLEVSVYVAAAVHFFSTFFFFFENDTHSLEYGDNLLVTLLGYLTLVCHLWHTESIFLCMAWGCINK